MVECKVSFEIVLPKTCHNVEKKDLRQAMRYLLERDLCELLTDDDAKCKVRFIKIEEK